MMLKIILIENQNFPGLLVEMPFKLDFIVSSWDS